MRANHPASPFHLASGEHAYEERITLWEADGFSQAVQLAEADAAEYCEGLAATELGLAQSYLLSEDLGQGTEVFSLIRTSDLDPEDYLNRHFDVGTEFSAEYTGE